MSDEQGGGLVKGNKVVKKIKRKRPRGVKTFKLVLWLLGRFHGQKENFIHIDQERNKVNSDYICRCKRNFQEYSAKAYCFVGGELHPARHEMCQLRNEKIELLAKREKFEETMVNYETITENQRRKVGRIEKSLEEVEARLKLVNDRLSVLEEFVNTCELVNEESILANKHRVESNITVYLQGARKFHNIPMYDVEIELDPPPKDLYEGRCSCRHCNQDVFLDSETGNQMEEENYVEE
jgi:hypothetical protein